MAATNHHTERSSTERWAKLDDLINRFEDAWQRGERPAISDYLSGGERERRTLLVELIHAELELPLMAGEPARVESRDAGAPSPWDACWQGWESARNQTVSQSYRIHE